MKTYRDDTYGFEIDIPEDWARCKENAPSLWNILFRLIRGWTPHVNAAFTCGPNEILNIVIEPMTPEPTPEVSERLFKLHAQQMGYADLGFGRITVGGRQHTWARYQFADKVWSKKYMIVLGGKGYAITASCKGQNMFAQREKIWDTIAASLRLPARASNSV